MLQRSVFMQSRNPSLTPNIIPGTLRSLERLRRTLSISVEMTINGESQSTKYSSVITRMKRGTACLDEDSLSGRSVAKADGDPVKSSTGIHFTSLPRRLESPLGFLASSQ
jgi:hypothetical protein